jgi:hypothetical protein
LKNVFKIRWRICDGYEVDLQWLRFVQPEFKVAVWLYDIQIELLQSYTNIYIVMADERPELKRQVRILLEVDIE